MVEDFDRKEDRKPVQKIEPIKDNTKLTDHKTAELFNTNRTYVNQAFGCNWLFFPERETLVNRVQVPTDKYRTTAIQRNNLP
jgi:hypothetical protein